MPSRKLVVWLLLLLLAISMAAGNVWIAAARSTIPLALSERIALKEVRREKHPGKDDVHLFHLASGKTLHVDAAVYETLAASEFVRKSAWSTELQHDGQAMSLA